MIRTIDNLLHLKKLKAIEQNLLEAPIFKTFKSTAYKQSDNIYDVMVARVLFSANCKVAPPGYDDKLLPYIYPVLELIGAKALLRAQLNVTFATPKAEISEPHIDTDIPCKVCILYLNTNNGGTKFTESGEFVESVRNRAVLFPSNVYHSAINTTDTKFRYVLNINYF